MNSRSMTRLLSYLVSSPPTPALSPSLSICLSVWSFCLPPVTLAFLNSSNIPGPFLSQGLCTCRSLCQECFPHLFSHLIRSCGRGLSIYPILFAPLLALCISHMTFITTAINCSMSVLQARTSTPAWVEMYQAQKRVCSKWFDAYIELLRIPCTCAPMDASQP